MIKFSRDILTGIWSLLKGLYITSKNLVTPAVTLQYPKKKDVMTERFRGFVDLRAEKCIACYQCVKICPTGCLALTHKQTADMKKVPETFTCNLELCCYCGLCEQVCPTSAIYLNKLYELTSYDHEKLHVNLLNSEKYREWAVPPTK